MESGSETRVVHFADLREEDGEDGMRSTANIVHLGGSSDSEGGKRRNGGIYLNDGFKVGSYTVTYDDVIEVFLRTACGHVVWVYLSYLVMATGHSPSCCNVVTTHVTTTSTH